MELKQNNKEQVHSRLRKTAAKLWGYNETDPQNYDPVIDLLFGACAYEFEKLSNDIGISHSRIIEKVSQILLPDVFNHPAPAYAVIHARPLVPERYSDPKDQFVFEKDFIDPSNKVVQRKVHFSPTSIFRLFDVEVVMMATTAQIVQVKDLLQKEIIVKSDTYEVPKENCVWIGLKTHPSLKSLKDLSIYFDWQNTSQPGNFLSLLHLSTFSCNGKPILTKSGFSEAVDDKYSAESIDIASFLDINVKMEKKIHKIFEKNFITIHEDVLPVKKKFPTEFNTYFPAGDLDKLKEELIWIRISFEEVISKDFLASLICTPNAFPVLNRRLHSSNRPYTLSDDLNILPLLTEDHFFSLKEIISSNNIKYQEVPFKRLRDYNPGTYTIRTQGVKRFDERDAMEHIEYLIELLREEHVAFKTLGSSLIEKELKDLQIIINRLNLNVSKSRELSNSTHFIIIKSEKAEDIWLEYWSTTGSFANNIHFGSNLLNNDFDKKSLKLLSGSAGGKNPPDQMERIYQFKNELLSRNRIVTNEDIKMVCFAELGNALEDVIIGHGAMVTGDRKRGIQNCIKVNLRFKNDISHAEKEENIRMVLKSLEERSSCIFRYNVVSVE